MTNISVLIVPEALSMVKKTQREYTECRDTGKEFNPLEHQDLRNEEVSPKETEKEEADGE